jgi:hemerythrin-like metal-binding protein
VTGIVWDRSLATGDIAVDEQHQQLFELYNGIHDAALGGDWGGSIEDGLLRLANYTLRHFDAEQRLMERSGYPADAMLDHVHEHQELIRRTDEIRAQFRAGEITTILPLVGLLQEWMTGHIYKCDRRLIEHCQAHGTAM